MKFHLGIFYKEYLDLIIKKEKRIDARFSKNKTSPYKKVKSGDIIYLKETGGLIVGEAIVNHVRYFNELNKKKIKRIITKFNQGLKIKNDFMMSKLESKYLTLIFLGEITKYDDPIKIEKRDRRGWIPLKNGINPNVKQLKLTKLC